MFSRIRTGYANLLTSAGHVALLLVAAQIGQPFGWVICLALIAVISFVAWASNLHRARAINATPTSRIGSAAQGYVEIYGRADRSPEYLALSTAWSQPCLWRRHSTYKRGSDDKWQLVDEGVSGNLFAVEDASGRCLIDPDEAEVITSHHFTRYEGDYKHVEQQLLPSDNLYALGEFTTVGGANSMLDASADVAELLAEWKSNRASLLQRFDLDGSGEVDLKEWELARRAARREVEKQHRELRTQPGVHVMRRPPAGQLYLISNFSPQELRRKYVLWGWLHLAIFFLGACASLMVMLSVNHGSQAVTLW